MSYHSVTRRFAHHPAEVARARRMVRSHLDAWGYGRDVEAMELAVSELVTNAVVHGRGLIDVRVSTNADGIRLEVADEGGGARQLGRVGDRAAGGVGGWGLYLVDTLSDAWGSGDRGDVSFVWMERRSRALGDSAEPGQV
ncbi:MAG TPA: ATP-binding protein [Acidimicrobiales bacterium]|nr:ATP-binding protein [Acidimicrobiales bacterium]